MGCMHEMDNRGWDGWIWWVRRKKNNGYEWRGFRRKRLNEGYEYDSGNNEEVEIATRGTFRHLQRIKHYREFHALIIVAPCDWAVMINFLFNHASSPTSPRTGFSPAGVLTVAWESDFPHMIAFLTSDIWTFSLAETWHAAPLWSSLVKRLMFSQDIDGANPFRIKAFAFAGLATTLIANSSSDLDTAEERATARSAFVEKYEPSGGMENSILTAASKFPTDTNSCTRFWIVSASPSFSCL